MAEPTIAAELAASLLNYATRRGAERAALLRACGLSEAQLGTTDGRVSATAYGALIGAAIAQTGDGALIMRHAAETNLDAISVVGLIVDAAGSLHNWIRELNRYVRLIADVPIAGVGDRFELVEDARGLWLVDHLASPNEAPQAIEDTFTRMIASFRATNPEQPLATAMEVTYASPEHVDAYAEILRVPVRFEAERNALCIAPEWATREVPPAKAYVFGLFTRHADALMAELERSASVRALVERQLLTELHAGMTSMEQTARALGMSRQTLYRRLKDEGVTFAEIYDELRARMARDYLSARKVSINETAYLLGFSEASSFIRAFKRWTGLSPTAFRAAQT